MSDPCGDHGYQPYPVLLDTRTLISMLKSGALDIDFRRYVWNKEKLALQQLEKSFADDSIQPVSVVAIDDIDLILEAAENLGTLSDQFFDFFLGLTSSSMF